jgi:hypothetical protein
MVPPFNSGTTKEELGVANLIQKPEFVHKPHFKIRSDVEIWIMSMCAGVVVFLGALLLQWVIYDRFLHEDGLRFIGSVISAAFAVFLVQSMSLRTRRSRLRELHRLESIALLNHHIRNALQAILCCSQTSESGEVIRNSVNRIDWVLSEVLPGIEDEPKIPDDSSTQ